MEQVHSSRPIPLTKKLTITSISVFLLIFVTENCYGKAVQKEKEPGASANGNSNCNTDHCYGMANDLLTNMNTEKSPCDDFYEFACGKWMQQGQKTPSSDWFEWMEDKSVRELHDFFRLGEKNSESEAKKKLRSLYKACIDINKTNIFTTLWEFIKEKLGQSTKTDNQIITAIVDCLNEIDVPRFPLGILVNNTSNEFEWIKSLAKLKKATGLDAIFGFDIKPDPLDQMRNHIWLGVPKKVNLIASSRDEEKNGKSKDIFKVISNMKTHFKLNPTIVTEIQNLAEASKQFGSKLKDITDDVNKNQNFTKIRLQLIDFQRSTNQLIVPNEMNIWREFLIEMFEGQRPIIDLNAKTIMSNQNELDYLKNVTKLIHETPNDVLHFYIWSDIVLILSGLYDHGEELFALEPGSRSNECLEIVRKAMPMAVTHVIRKSNFFNETKPQVQQMAENIRRAFNNATEKITWIDRNTSLSIFEKSNAMRILVGLSNETPNGVDLLYKGLSFTNSHLKNVIRFHRWEMGEKLKTLDSVFDPERYYDPTDVNGQYFTFFNSLYLSFGLLDYPFYGQGIKALNYGAIGSIIGHELTHGFDNDGRKYDQNGEFLNRWTNNSASEFEIREKCFVDQYNNYTKNGQTGSAANMAQIDGERTLSENIADNGGLRLAYSAYKSDRNKNEKELSLPILSRPYTNDQLFFLSYGHSMCELQTQKHLEKYSTDAHAPRRLRVNVVLANFEQFQEAFSCTNTSKMVSENRCRIW